MQWAPSGKKFLKDFGKFPEKYVNDLAESNPKKLMDMELDYLLLTCQPGQGQWLQLKAVSHYGSPEKMSFEEFISSTKSPDQLALVFHGHYERSADTPKVQKERMENALNWYEFLKQL